MFSKLTMKIAIKVIAACARNTSATSINDAKIALTFRTGRSLACIGFWFCMAIFQIAGADTKPAPTSTEAVNNTVSSPAGATTARWTCNAFYLPARNIWQRTVVVEYEGDVVRSVQIDGVAVHTFTLEGTSLLTGVDGERIQFDVAAMTWTSDLRGLASSTGRCTL